MKRTYLRPQFVIIFTVLAAISMPRLSVAGLVTSADETIFIEAEAAVSLVKADILERRDASGGRVVRWQEGTRGEGRADYMVTLPRAGKWHLWLRTQAADHLNNGLFLELNGQRLAAPPGHPMAPTDVVFLRKHETMYAWEPEWQAPGHGRHRGPIVIEFPAAGEHTLSLVARTIERPFIDCLALTVSDRPAFIQDGKHVPARIPWHLPGQLVVHPKNPARFARIGPDGITAENIMLCGLGSPEGFLYLLADQQEHIIAQMQEHGGNMLYMIVVRSHGGDGTPQENPFIGHDPARGLDRAVLERWAGIFKRAETAGIYVFLLVYDDGAMPFGERHDDAVPPAEAAFFAELMRTFNDHPNLVWCVSEEYSDALTPARAEALAFILNANDIHGRPVAIHQQSGDTRFNFKGSPHVHIFAQQARADSPHLLHAEVLAAVRHADGGAIVHMAENWNNRQRDLALKSDHTAAVAAGDRRAVRQRNWAVAMAGGTCQVIGPWEGISNHQPATPEMFKDMGTMVRFLSATPLHEFDSADWHAWGDATWMLATPDRTKAVAYALSGNRRLELRVAEGDYAVSWIDCISGQTASQHATAAKTPGHHATLLLERPPGIGEECAVYAERQ